MAEASVARNKYFCHNCNQHFGLEASDLLCPHCQSGFVEEMEVAANPLAEMQDASNGASSHSELLDGSWRQWSSMDFDDPGEGISFRINIVPSSSGSGGASTSTQNGQASSNGATLSFGGARPRFQYNLRQPRSNPTDGTSGSDASGRDVPPMNHTLVIEDFLQQLINGTAPTAMFGSSATVQGPGGRSPLGGMFSTALHGNPEDYAWGVNGLDNIITQLLGQLDGSGAPPASETSIGKLPTLVISKDDVQMKKDCSICMEAFVKDDKAKKLPCAHIFHINCIDPWLKLHNTCPICRTNIEGRGMSAPCHTDQTTSSTSNGASTSNSGASSSGVYYADAQD